MSYIPTMEHIEYLAEDQWRDRNRRDPSENSGGAFAQYHIGYVSVVHKVELGMVHRTYSAQKNNECYTNMTRDKAIAMMAILYDELVEWNTVGRYL